VGLFWRVLVSNWPRKCAQRIMKRSLIKCISFAISEIRAFSEALQFPFIAKLTSEINSVAKQITLSIWFERELLFSNSEVSVPGGNFSVDVSAKCFSKKTQRAKGKNLYWIESVRTTEICNCNTDLKYWLFWIQLDLVGRWGFSGTFASNYSDGARNWLIALSECLIRRKFSQTANHW